VFEDLVKRVSAISGITDLAMTSNGFLFCKSAEALKQAGLRVSVSAWTHWIPQISKKDYRPRRTSSCHGEHRPGQELGFHPVKVNAVIIRGLNDHEIEALAEFGRQRNLTMRFIEFMPLDSARAWLKEMVVPGRELLERLQKRFRVATRGRPKLFVDCKALAFADGGAEIGIIAPVSEPFCGHCKPYPAHGRWQDPHLPFSVAEHDLRSVLRNDRFRWPNRKMA